MTTYDVRAQEDLMSSLETPTVEGSYRVMPSDIDATSPFLSAFGKAEVEHVALGLVLYCQDKGGWVPFTEDELTEHFRAAKAAGRTFPYEAWDLDHIGPDGRCGTKIIDARVLFMSPSEYAWWQDRPWLRTPRDVFEFSWLSPEEGLLVRLGDDGKYRVTELFIERCHRASPKVPPPTT